MNDMNGGNVEMIDGIPWRRVAGRLWTDFDHAAEYSGFAKTTLYNKSTQGVLKPRQFGPRKNVAKDELDAMLTGPGTGGRYPRNM